MLCDWPMSPVRALYEQIARPWTHEELAKRFDEARRHAGQPSPTDYDDRAETPVAILASAVPALAAVSVAIHVIHALPAASDRGLLDDLLLNVEKNADVALQRMHRALELDGLTHGYTAAEYLQAVYEIAAGLLESASFDCEPPSLVEEATAAVGWLSQAIVDVDQDALDTTAAIVDGLGRTLALEVFAGVAHDALAPAP
jgi:hypothetical protein